MGREEGRIPFGGEAGLLRITRTQEGTEDSMYAWGGWGQGTEFPRKG